MMLDLSLYLSPLGYHCIKQESQREVLKFLKSNTVDLILLDIMMPDMSGLEACQEIRKNWDIPIIMLTALGDKTDIVRGLNIGADDYISKPFDEEELVARIEAVIRREQNNQIVFPFSDYPSQDPYQLFYQGDELSLTPKEFGMMSLFLNNPNHVFTRDHLIESVWGYNVSTEDRTIDSHVRNLREKLRKAGFPADDHLLTVWGVGYKWNGKVKHTRDRV